MKKYMSAWAGKHPMPYDFFYSINNASGKDLNWYWKNWFFDRNHADLELEGIIADEVIIKNIGGLSVPVELDIMYVNGSNTKISADLDIWKHGNIKAQIKVQNPDMIKSIRLGNEKILDVDLSNNYLEF